MRRGTITCILIGALLLCSAAQAAVPKDFTLVGKTVEKHLDGDKASFVEKLTDGIRGPKAGKARYRCERRRRATTCTARFDLRDGSILAKGRVGETRVRVPGENRATTIPIKDGTGSYRNVSGLFLTNAITKRLSQLRFDFDR